MSELFLLWSNTWGFIVMVGGAFFAFGFLATLSDRLVYGQYPRPGEYPVFLDAWDLDNLTDDEIEELWDAINETLWEKWGVPPARL